MTSFPLDFHEMAEGTAIPVAMIRQSPKLLSFGLSLLLKSRLRGVRTKSVYGTTLMDNEVSRVIYVDFLGKALAQGRYVAAPEPMVLGRGLASIQPALDIQRKGVSATKVVVTL